MQQKLVEENLSLFCCTREGDKERSSKGKQGKVLGRPESPDS
jgi:hypothetical protein